VGRVEGIPEARRDDGEVEVINSRRLGWAWVLGRLREGWR
jgi:hypothetical protein